MEQRLNIRRAQESDAPQAARLAEALWPGHAPGEMEAELRGLMGSADAAVFLCFSRGKAVGFAQCQLRRDYVEGCDTSPVGYLEGVYVTPETRLQGAATLLLRACEAWAKERGCTEFASDCELDNEDSLRFHLRAGFEEANRIICFTKKLT